jgi:DNA-directed RNA polymerase subunit beta'
MYLKQVPMSITEHILPLTTKLTINLGDFIDIGEPITQGMIDSHELLNTLFVYHKEFDGIIKGMTRSLNKFQVILSQSIQAIYQDQGVNVSSKHIEILVKQLTSKVIIVSGGDTPFLAGELLSIAFIRDIYEIFNSAVDCSYKTPHFEPKLLSATNAALNKDGFLSAAGFQETRKILTKAAIEGKSDWLRGLKESLMSGRMIPAGSAFLNYKDYLNNVYRFKKKKNFKE